jgi:hypothetical protein
LSVGAAKTIAPKFDTQAYGADDADFDDFMVPVQVQKYANGIVIVYFLQGTPAFDSSL